MHAPGGAGIRRIAHSSERGGTRRLIPSLVSPVRFLISPSHGRDVAGVALGPQMRELRIGTIRALFAFDRHRVAILLLGGDKRGTWNESYARALP